MIGQWETIRNYLKKKFNKKTSEEEKATGIAPPEESALDEGIRSIIEQFHDFDSKRMEEKHQKELKTKTLKSQRNLEKLH